MNPNKKTLMVQGCTSDAGKSTLAAGLCRLLARRGLSVAPFKPQNMALNSAVTIDGGEIGRAQALQAQAARLPPHSDFNPVLLKPGSDCAAQVIIHGKLAANLDARAYQDYKAQAMQAVMASYERLTSQYDYLIVEGAGSPAEINLRSRDIANMGFAEAVDCPVILIADIDRGGVFAHLVGTLELLSASEQARVIGFVINRFRGDLSLLESGLRWLEKRTGKPVLGVLPYLHGLHLDAEDALPKTCAIHATAKATADRLHVIAPALPRISNATDCDPLRLHPQVDFHFISPNESIPPADLIVLPGSKAVAADLAWLRAQGWESALRRHLRYGGKVIGICGGLQMLGRALHGWKVKRASPPGWRVSACWITKPPCSPKNAWPMSTARWHCPEIRHSTAMKSIWASATAPHSPGLLPGWTDNPTARARKTTRFSPAIVMACSIIPWHSRHCSAGQAMKLNPSTWPPTARRR